MGQFFDELKRRNVLRVGIAYLASAWLLVQILETLLPIYELPATLIRPFIIVLVIGFPVALIFSWAYEITPGGLKLDKDVDRSASITHNTGKKLDRAIIVVLTIAIGFFAVDKFLLDPVRDSARDESVAQQTRSDVFLERFGESSIAVLPFVNMSDDASNEYFSDGISEELLNLLAQIPRLRVISRSTMFQFKGKEIDIRALAEQLDVSHVLEGSVRKAGNQIRITAQLIEASTDTHLWSNTYDRNLTDIFKIQDEISAKIVESLRAERRIESASIPTATPPSSIDAFESFLRGRQLMAERSRDSVQLAVAELQYAVTLDPDYAIAHAQLAIAYRLQFRGQYGDLSMAEASLLAKPHAELALALNPKLAEGHAALGLVSGSPGDADEAISHFEEAVRLNPNYSDAYVWLSTLLGFQAHYDEKIAMQELSVILDPRSIPARYNYILSLISMHRFDEVNYHLAHLAPESERLYVLGKARKDLVESGWAAGPFGHLHAYRANIQSGFVRGRIARLLLYIGLRDEAMMFEQAPDLYTFLLAGESEEALVVAQANAERHGTDEWDQGLGLAFAGSGNFAEALPWLRRDWILAGREVGTYLGLSITHATVLLQAIRAGKSDDGADEVLVAMNAEIKRLRTAGILGEAPFDSTDYFAALLALQSGKHEQGLTFLATAVDRGAYIPPNLAFLRFVYDDPAIAPILSRYEAKRTRERDKVLAVVCTDNPYADVWVPMESTCNSYTAASVN